MISAPILNAQLVIPNDGLFENCQQDSVFVTIANSDTNYLVINDSIYYNIIGNTNKNGFIYINDTINPNAAVNYFDTITLDTGYYDIQLNIGNIFDTISFRKVGDLIVNNYEDINSSLDTNTFSVQQRSTYDKMVSISVVSVLGYSSPSFININNSVVEITGYPNQDISGYTIKAVVNSTTIINKKLPKNTTLNNQGICLFIFGDSIDLLDNSLNNHIYYLTREVPQSFFNLNMINRSAVSFLIMDKSNRINSCILFRSHISDTPERHSHYLSGVTIDDWDSQDYFQMQSTDGFIILSCLVRIGLVSKDSSGWSVSRLIDINLLSPKNTSNVLPSPTNITWTINNTISSLIINTNSSFRVFENTHNQIISVNLVFSNLCDSNTISNTYNIRVFPNSEICVVTIDDTTGSNVIVWEKQHNIRIEKYKILRETSTSNVFDTIATIPFNDLSIYIDTTSNPGNRSYTYSIISVDSVFGDSERGLTHTTIHVAPNLGQNNDINLSWSLYNGVQYSTYKILRSVNNNPFIEIGQVSSNAARSFTDNNTPSGLKKYLIEVELNTPCVPTSNNLRFSNPISSILSNTVSFNSISVDVFNRDLVSIFPNPTTGRIIIDTQKNIKDLNIIDAQGNQLNITIKDNQVDLSPIANGGVYSTCFI